MKEGMPTTLNGFKDHPLYVSSRFSKFLNLTCHLDMFLNDT